MARYALVAGIAKYSNPLLPLLSKTATDAAAVAEVLKQHGNYRVTLLNGEVTAKQLADALRTLLQEQAVKNEALIYFTGHGVTGVTGVDSLEQPQGYLAASDCNVTKASEQWIVRGGGISLNGLNQLIRQSDLSNLVVIFDSCHSGEFLERSLVENALTVFRSRQDYYLITACRRFEQAWAKKSEQHSVFTGALLAGLSPERAGDNGQVTVDRLFDFIASELSNSRQEPIRLGVGRSLTLVQYPPKKMAVVVDEACPYQGLQAFGKEQARFFFGRDKVVQLLVEKLGKAKFVPIIGASGSGKSSVVRAGLIPQLEKNGWRILEPILPGDEPLAELKTVLIELFGRTEGREVYSLIKTEGLRPVIERLSSSERLLLLVDQFEEVFTLCPKEEEKRQFIELLTQVAEIPDSRLAIVTTMRADFLEPCLSYELLTQLIQNEAVYMPPLVGAELEEAIVSPTELQGYQLETGLLGAILSDIGNEQGCLPLLQFALTELWEQRDRQTHQLTLAKYKQLGGVIGALNRHTEQLYQSFSAQEQDWVKRISLKLVRTGADAKDTRQRQSKSMLLDLAGDNLNYREVISTVLDQLIDGRLLVADREGEDSVDLAHEALMEGWERFVQWRQENRELRRLIDRIQDAHREWLICPQDENLMMGGLLAQVRERWKELQSNLPTLVRKFYYKSDAYERGQVAKAQMGVKAEEMLRRVERIYGSLLRDSSEGIFHLTLNKGYITANPALARIYGYDSPEQLMTQITDIGKLPYVAPRRHEDLATLLQKFDTLSDFESQVYRKDGSIIWINENIRTVRDANGVLLYYEGTVSNITERKQTEVNLSLAWKNMEQLLLNVLPQAVADRLKQEQQTIAENFEEVTVLFADLIGFTAFSTCSSPIEQVEVINGIFSKFDLLVEQHGVEKIKTIGSTYMVAAGLPLPRSDHAQAIADMALDMQAALAQFNAEIGEAFTFSLTFSLRIGINSGSVIAGIVGVKKFSYELWGNTVTMASGMESKGEPGRVHVSDATYKLLGNQYLFEKRGAIHVKGRGETVTYWLIGKKEK